MPPTAAELLDLAIRATAAYRRGNLGERLAVARRRLLDPEVRVLVIGEFKQGKSQLVNALVGARICPVDDDIATAVPTRSCRHRSRRVRPGAGRRRAQPESVPSTSWPSTSASRATRQPGGLSHVEVALPARVLAGGLELVDTPGSAASVGCGRPPRWPCCPSPTRCCWSPTRPRSTPRPSWSSCAGGEAVPELSPACSRRSTCTRSGAGSTTSNRGHLPPPASTPVIPVSSALRWHAMERNDNDLNVESGFPVLATLLHADRRQGRPADPAVGGQHVLRVTEQLSAAMPAELARAGTRRPSSDHPRAGRGPGPDRPRCGTGPRAGSRPSPTASPT